MKRRSFKVKHLTALRTLRTRARKPYDELTRPPVWRFAVV
jgi:hypothetical protein